MSDSESLTFFVEGTPIAKGRPRTVVNGNGKSVTFTPVKTTHYEATVRVHALRAMRLSLWRQTRPEDRFEVNLIFDFDDDRKRDLDNLGKAILDSLQPPKGGSGGTILLDDWQVVKLSMRRRLYAVRPGVWIHVARAQEIRVPLRETAPDNAQRARNRAGNGPGETQGVAGRLAGRNAQASSPFNQKREVKS